MSAQASYFRRTGDHAFAPTEHAGGGWDPEELHFSPLAGLVVHAIERHRAASGTAPLLLGRIAFDVLGRLALQPCEIRVETVRPGRTIELTEAVVVIEGRPVVRARAWYLIALDTASVAGGAEPALPAPRSLEPWHMAGTWPGGFVASLEVRPVRPPQAGRTTAWVAGKDLVADEQVGPAAAFLALVDTANGIAPRQPPTRWMFPNVDLTVHLHRQPQGAWTGLDVTQVFGASGQGVTSTVLHDEAGEVGRAEQLLTVRPAPSR